jgi:hypothetical protein
MWQLSAGAVRHRHAENAVARLWLLGARLWLLGGGGCRHRHAENAVG